MTTKTNDNGVTFQAWFNRADQAVHAVCGLGLDDLADGPSYDAWSDGVEPDDYAHDLLVEEGFPF